MQMIKGMNHVGIVVKNIDEMAAFFRETFGAEEVSRTEFPELKQISSTLQVGNSFFELMEPTSPGSVVGKFLEAKGGGLHHISLLCDDLEACCRELEAKGLSVIGKMFNGPVKVAFLHPKSAKGLLIELSQKD
jgi:methylmalonyl-CoA epimerase